MDDKEYCALSSIVGFILDEKVLSYFRGRDSGCVWLSSDMLLMISFARS